MTAPVQRRIAQRLPPGLFSALMSMVVGIAAVFALGAWWTDKRFADLEREQNRELCGVLSVITTGPEPPAGPSGDRARIVRDGLIRWRAALNCPD